MGVEAIVESTGKESGRISQVINSSQENEATPTTDYLKNSTLIPNISVRAATYFSLLGVLYTFVNIPQFLVSDYNYLSKRNTILLLLFAVFFNSSLVSLLEYF